MVSLTPGMALYVIYGKDREQKQAPKKELDTRTHHDRISEALTSCERLEKLTVDYNGVRKGLQEYILEDALSSSDISAVRFIHFPSQEWMPSVASDRMTKYFWGYDGWNAFVSSYANSKALSKVDWIDNYDGARIIADNLSFSIGRLVDYPIFSHLHDAANIRKVKGAIDGSIEYMQNIKKIIPAAKFSDFMTPAGRKKLDERSQLELKLQTAAYGLVLAGKVANVFISELGHKARKEYIKANPEQLSLF